MTFDALLGELSVSLHDAYLLRIEVDWVERSLTLALCIPFARQTQDRIVKFEFSGLVYFVASPPDALPSGGREDEEVPWMDGGPGPMTEEDRKALPVGPSGSFVHHFYTREWWQTFHVCAMDVTHEWLEPGPVPYRSGKRDLLRQPRQE